MATITKTQARKDYLISYFNGMENAHTEDWNGNLFMTYTKNGSFVVGILYKRQTKVADHYRFSTEQKRADYIAGRKSYMQKQIDAEASRLAQYTANRDLFVKGAVLYSSWGYEQTNIDFYVILERKGDFVIIQECKQQREMERDDTGKCWPIVSELIGDPIRKKISKYASINLASYKFCSLHDGTPRYFSNYA